MNIVLLLGAIITATLCHIIYHTILKHHPVNKKIMQNLSDILDQHSMQYFFYFKQQARSYCLFVLSMAVTYGVVCFLLSPVVLTSGQIGAMISGTFTYVFLAPIAFTYYDSPKNKL